MTRRNRNTGMKVALSFLSFLLLLSLVWDPILSFFHIETMGDMDSLNLRPFQISNHILGTDHRGQDLLSLTISASKYSLTISFFSAFFAMIIGVFIGSVAGYFGDKSIRIKRFQLIALVVIMPVVLYYLFLSINIQDWFLSVVAIILGAFISFLLWHFLSLFLKKHTRLNHSISLPIDILNTKVTEVFFAIPAYFIILSFSSFLGDSIWSIVFVLSITSWPTSALLIRAEMHKIREMSYIEALKLSKLSRFRILFFHAIPNAISPVLVNFVFFISGLLIIESTLSYIGISMTSDTYTWGKIISGFKHNSGNWWVALFPGIVIFLSILSFHKIGHWMEEKLL